jgi:hypothetical protein
MIDHLRELESEMVDIENKLINHSKKIEEFFIKNDKEIKKLFPQKGKVYLLKKEARIKRHFDMDGCINYKNSFAVKVVSTKFYRKKTTDQWRWNAMPLVEGIFLDKELSPIRTEHGSIEENCYVSIDSIGDEILFPNKKINENDNLYIINVENTNLYKIGVSNDVKKRLIGIQTGNPFKCVIYKIYPSKYAYRAEAYLQNKFKNKNTNGEWFSLDYYDIMEIDTIMTIQGFSFY